MKTTSNNSIIIAGFAGIGKTTLAQKYANCIDLESSLYKYLNNATSRIELEKLKGTKTRVFNPEWPQNYINAIKNAIKNYDIVLVWIDPEEALVHYDNNKINYTICYPAKEAFETYIDRYRNRGNSEEWIKKVSNYFYNKAFDQFSNLNCPKIVLKKGETLESYLKENSFTLLNKEEK